MICACVSEIKMLLPILDNFDITINYIDVFVLLMFDIFCHIAYPFNSCQQCDT